jgi:Tol biopolymer transport system component
LSDLIHAALLRLAHWLPGNCERLVGTAIGATLRWRTVDPQDAPEMRVEINTPAANSTSFAVSPDGRHIAFTANGQRGAQLWIRSLDSVAPVSLPGTEGGLYPFWSPDSRSIGFFAANRLKRLEIDSGQSQPLANVTTPAGGTWGRDGTILYIPNANGGVFRVSDTGGESRKVTPGRSHELATRQPQFLPDGRHYLFYVAFGSGAPGVYVGELGNETIRRILTIDAPALYSSGHLLFVREGTLFAQRFDPSTFEISGSTIRIADGVAVGLFGSAVSASKPGSFAYRTEAGQSQRQLVSFDRSGSQLGTVGDVAGLVSNPSLSPDGGQVIVQRTVQGNVDLWSIDLDRNLPTRLTLDPGADTMPLWSPDGRRIIFNSAGVDGSQHVIKHLDGTGADEPLLIPSGGTARIACDWSSDGQFLLYKQIDEVTSTTDLWALPMEGPGAPFPVVRTAYNERDGQFSPDGKSIAFESDESGRAEIYVQLFPGPGTKTRISTDGGTQVRWRRDGKELFYLAPDGTLMSVPVSGAADRSGVGTPVPMFKTHLAPFQTLSRQQYVVAPGGQRFVIVTQTEQGLTPPITLVLNWKPSAKH